MQIYDKTAVFDEDLKPLLDEVRRVCRQHSIQYVTCFQIAARENGESSSTNGYILNDDDWPAGIRVALMDKIARAPQSMLVVFAERMGLLK